MYGPSLPSTRRLRSRMLPNVPRIITSWWPRRAPYELKSSGADAVGLEPLARRRPGGDGAGRGDVVGGDRVAQRRRATRAPSMSVDAAPAPRPDPVEERRAGDVRGRRLPRVAVAVGDRRAPASARRPRRPRRRSPGTAPASIDAADDRRGPPPGVGQMSARKTGRPSSPMPSGSRREVDVDPPGQRERDDERRRGEVAGPDERVDPALEVAVARQDGGRDELVGLDRPGDRLVERAGVADAGRAAVAGQGEAEGRERRRSARPRSR